MSMKKWLTNMDGTMEDLISYRTSFFFFFLSWHAIYLCLIDANILMLDPGELIFTLLRLYSRYSMNLVVISNLVMATVLYCGNTDLSARSARARGSLLFISRFSLGFFSLPSLMCRPYSLLICFLRSCFCGGTSSGCAFVLFCRLAGCRSRASKKLWQAMTAITTISHYV
jgi:hypothetical protein